MNTQTLNGSLFLAMVRGGLYHLRKNREFLNELNVFPIPDGDTGNNLCMTLEAGCIGAARTQTELLGAVASDLADAMLFGARGNSGVILSRIFKGMALQFQGCAQADVQTVAKAFCRGALQAYEAVAVPVQGTILTVCQDAADFARDHLSDSSSLLDYFSLCLEEADRSLERTPRLLDALAKAGVVDSGGAGFLCILEGMKQVLEDAPEHFPLLTETENPAFSPLKEAGGLAAECKDTSVFSSLIEADRSADKLPSGYCTEFLLQLQADKTDLSAFSAEDFSEGLHAFGDSIVSFCDGSLVKVHIHTITPGDVLNYGQRFGEFLTVKIENFKHTPAYTEPELPPASYATAALSERETAAAERTWRRPTSVRKACGIVVVSDPDLGQTLFHESGADYIIPGGRGANPPVQAFLDAFAQINAACIFVLPSHKNILPAAQQAASLYTASDIRVLHSCSIGESYAALSMYDASASDMDEMEQDMCAVMEGVLTAEISRAIRDYTSEAVQVKSGEYIGFSGSDILAKAKDSVSVLFALAERYAAKRDVVLILYGSRADTEEAAAICASLQKTYPQTEFILHSGGQSPCDYIMIFE